MWPIDDAHNVLPLDDSVAGADQPGSAGRPVLIKARRRFCSAAYRLSENSIISVKNKSHP
jgi:hypothetical protein